MGSWNWESPRSYEDYIETLGAADNEMLQNFLNENGFDKVRKVSSSIKHIFRYIGGNLDHGRERDLPPHLDHGRLFKNSRTKKKCLAYHPYKDPELIKEDVIRWAKERGLCAKVYNSSYSWYYPGNSCLVIISDNDDILANCKR